MFFLWRPKNSPAEHGHRWPTVPLDESPPESNGKPERNGHHDPETLPPPNQKKNDENTVTGSCPRGVSPKK